MKFYISLGFLLCSLLAAVSSYKDPNFVDNRSVIVHLFEWKWIDIAEECERFLGPKGFGGVQTSPANENLMVTSRDRPWWERYQPISYKLTTRSGDEEAFADMVKRCNAVGVRIYVDAIFNHMTGTWPENVGTGGSTVDFATWDYPGVPFTKDDFNSPICDITNYGDPVQVRNCQLIELKDLDQSKPNVRSKISGFLNKLIGYGVAGFRIDAAKHMWPEDLQAIYEALDDLNTAHGFAANSRPYLFQEVIDLGGEPISSIEYTPLGAVTEFKASAELGRAFRGQNPLKWLENWGVGWGLLPQGDSLIFIDNHDNQRGHGAGGDSILTYKMPKPYKAAVAFLLAHPYGEPRIMSSFAFDDGEKGPPMDADQNTISPIINPDGTCGNGWVCEHRWPAISNMVEFRSVVVGTNYTEWWDNGNNQIAFCREEKGFYAVNIDYSDLSETLQVCVPAGTYCDIVTGGVSGTSCAGRTVVVDGTGNALITIGAEDEEASLVIHVGPGSKLK